MFSIIYKKKKKKWCDTYEENTPIHRQIIIMHRNIDMYMYMSCTYVHVYVYTVSTVPE